MTGVIELPEVTITAGQESEEERRRREILEATRVALQGMSAETAPALAAVQQTAIGATPPAPATPAAPGTPATSARPPQAFTRANPADVGRGEPSRYPFPDGLGEGAERPPRAPAPMARPLAGGPTGEPTIPPGFERYLAARASKGGDPAAPQAPGGVPPRNVGQESVDRQGLADAQAASDQQRRMRLALSALAGAMGGLGPDRMGRLMAQAREARPDDPYARAQEQVGQRREAQQAERAASEATRRQAAEDEDRTYRRGLEERRVAATEDRVEGAEERRATSAQLAEDLRDPESPISRADQAALQTAAEMFGGEVAGALTPERIQSLPSSTIRSNPALRDIMIQGRQNDAHAARMEADQARADRRQAQRGAQGGGGGAPLAERRQRAVAAFQARYRVSAEEAEAAVPQSRRALEAYERSAATARVLTEESRIRAGASEGQRTQRDDAAHRVPGWVRLPNAPRLSDTELRQARESVGTLNELRANAAELRQIAEQVGAMEQAGASAGVLGPKMARARELHESVSNALRTIGGYGVPAASELARMDRLAPQLQTAQGLVNAAELYRALPEVMSRNAANRLRALGYVEPSSRVRVRRDGRPGTVSAQNVRPDDEVINE